MPPDPLAWHRPFGARSLVSSSKKKFEGAPNNDFGGGGGALPSFGSARGYATEEN